MKEAAFLHFFTLEYLKSSRLQRENNPTTGNPFERADGHERRGNYVSRRYSHTQTREASHRKGIQGGRVARVSAARANANLRHAGHCRRILAAACHHASL